MSVKRVCDVCDVEEVGHEGTWFSLMGPIYKYVSDKNITRVDFCSRDHLMLFILDNMSEYTR